MELHLVHQSQDKKIAVIGLLYDIGRSNPFLEKVYYQKKLNKTYLQFLIKLGIDWSSSLIFLIN